MPDVIHQLPDSIANQIAAGEVIQRPASAVKELMENAIDAGATHIRLIIKDAGKQLIQVIDNGCGMSETDARMCFERHATSKISTIDDLFAIRTMGFRGEAMASIAAIAQVEMKTKRREDDLGAIITIEGAEVTSHEPAHVSDGTSVAVKNLFYNVPARRNFLKSNPVETRHIIDEFQRIALSHPAIHFEMHHNGMLVFGLPPANLRQRIVNVLGNHYNERLVPVQEETNIVNIHGFVGKPDSAKKVRGDQFFFVNHRFIRNNYLNHAVVSAYQEMLPKDSFPLYVLFVDIDPARIDINVHPTKQEIKFEDEKIVYAFVNTAVKGALAKFSITPTLDFDRETAFDRIAAFSQPVTAHHAAALPSFPSKENIINRPRDYVRMETNLRHWEELYRVAREQAAQTVTIPSESEQETKESADAAHLAIEDFSEQRPSPFQLHERYIVSQIKSGFILIDQQAAHERILYEKYLAAFDKHNQLTQQQLFPETIHVAPTDVVLLRELLPDLQALGFDIQEFGGNAFVLHGIPSDLQEGNQKVLIESMLDEFKQNQTQVKLNRRPQLALTMARRTSIKTGAVLSEREMRNLIDQLFACEAPYLAPDGRHTIITFELSTIEGLFRKSE